MFGIFDREREDEDLDKLITRLTADMQVAGPETDAYAANIAYLERLNKLKLDNKPKPISRDSLVMVAGNLAGILVIVAYEQKHVFTSKGLSQLLRSSN